MFNVKFKSAWTICLMLVTMAISAQEICNNGIDDDGDALIDLNDDECDCDTVEPLTYTNGTLCRRLDLELDYPGATSYQWYNNGIAIPGETNLRLSRNRWMDMQGEGTYQVLIEHPGGCVLSVPYEAIMIEYNTDLGEVSLCEGDTLFVAGFPFSKEGFQRFKTVAIDGCDSTIVFKIDFVDPTTERINAEHCLGGTYINGGIIATEPGIYLDTIISSAGCDSLIRRVNLTFEEVEPVVFSVYPCFGSTYEHGTESTTESGLLEYISSEGACDTTYLIDVQFEPKIEETINATICEGGLYENGDISTMVPGEYTTLFTSGDGCDSTVNVVLTLEDVIEHRVPVSICQGQTYENDNGGISTGVEGEYPYTSTLGECDSLIIIELTVDPPTQMITDEVICQGKSFEWRGNTYSTADTFSEIESNDGECDIEHVLNLSFDPIPENVVSETICQGQVYTWMGEDYTEADRYEQLLQLADECDVIEVLELTVTAPEVEKLSEVICYGEVFDLGNVKADTTGIWTTIVSEAGQCDVEVELDLTILSEATGFVEATLCNGDIFELYDLTATEPGSYVANTTASTGCDSIIYVELTAGFAAPTFVDEAICPGDCIVFQGNDYCDEGDYPVTLIAESGCDSIVTLRLAINDKIDASYDVEICEGESYQLHDIDESDEGIYTTEVVTGTGCDSIITLNLKVIPASYRDLEGQICEGDIFTDWPGDDITEAGSYVTVVPNRAGCDSTITLTLNVLSEMPNAFTEQICEGDTYINGGIEATVSGRYETDFISAAGCDSFVVVALEVLPLNQRIEEMKICPGDVVTFYGQELTEAGSYTERFSNENGCDSVVTYNIELNASVADVEVPDTILVNLGAVTEDITPVIIDGSFVSFQWLDSEGNIMTLDQELTDFYTEEDTYVEFLAVNEYGCEIRERVNINVELVVDIYAPNVIQPGLDPINSNFTLGGNESVIGIQEINIFDRWGELVFTDSHEGRLQSYVGWDGEYNGRSVKPGVFTWAAVFEIIDGSFVKKAGSVTVIR